jgi:hypothetical protein
VNAERAELVAYQALDKQQRGIEFALLDRELTAARKELAKVRARQLDQACHGGSGLRLCLKRLGCVLLRRDCVLFSLHVGSQGGMLALSGCPSVRLQTPDRFTFGILLLAG